LHLSNVIGWRGDSAGVEITTRSRLGGATVAAPTAVGTLTDSSALSPEWKTLADYATSDELAVIEALAATDAPMPEMGVEVGAGIPLTFAWPEANKAIALGLTDDERAAVASAGWLLIDPETDDLAAHLAAPSGQD
jgi:hypothetical protein